jgi:hypothetical protein
MIPRDRFVHGAHFWHHEVMRAFDGGQCRFFILEWARRHRKTTLALNLAVREACRHPKSRYLYVAPTKVAARDICWNDPMMLNEALPDKSEMGWEKNEQMMLVKFANEASLQLTGAEEPDRLRGGDYVGVIFDEWALMSERVWTEIFFPIMTGSSDAGRRWAMFLYTPVGINHATLMFNDAACLDEVHGLPSRGAAERSKPLWFSSRLDAEVAGLMDPAALALARETMPRSLYDQELRCSRVTEEERCLITSETIHGLSMQNETLYLANLREHRSIVAVDPAFGGDVAVVMGIRDGRIEILNRITSKLQTAQLVMECKTVARMVNTRNFIVDCIGVGRGVADGLSDDVAGYDVQNFNSSEAPGNEELFANKRAEAYYATWEEMSHRRMPMLHDPELIRQLPVASRYTTNSRGKMIIQPKDKVKKVLGCSPDAADAFVYGIYGLRKVDPDSNVRSGSDDYGNKSSLYSDFERNIQEIVA